MKYRVFAAQPEDINSGWVWIAKPTVAGRSIVRLLNRANGKKVYCEALAIDENFLNTYNQSPRLTITDRGSAVVLNEWYRNRLGGIGTKAECDLEISIKDNFVGRTLACIHHPQVVVRLATWLGLLGLALGLVGVALGFLSLR